MLYLVFSLLFASPTYADDIQVVMEITQPEILSASKDARDFQIRFDDEAQDDDMIMIGDDHEKKIAPHGETSQFKKLLRGELISASGQAVALIFFLSTPSNISNWKPTGSKEFWDAIPKNFKNAFTKPPVMDKDPFIVNYIAHPYSGSVYYNSIRSQGFTPLQSFAFAFAESTFWEYFIESTMEPPSIQDLIATPLVGALIGEASHQATRLMRRNGFNTFEKIAVTIINPAYVLNNGYH